MKKKILLIITIIIVVILTLCTCEHNGNIKIGYVGSLSGLNTELGVSGRNGASMAVDKINEAGGINGKKLELIIKDDKNSKEIALRTDIEFVKEGVVAIVGHMTSGMADLTVPYINQEKMLMISPTIAADTLGNKDDYFFRMIPSNKEQAVAIAEAMSLDKINKVAVLYDVSNLSFVEGLKNQFVIDYLKLNGDIVLEEPFSSKQGEFDDIAAKILESKAEGVFIIAAADTSVMFSQYFYKNNAKIKIFLPSWAMTTDLLQHGGKSVEGATLVNFYDKSSEVKDYKSFYAEYKSKFGGEPTFAAQFSYEAILVLAEAIKKGKDLSAETLKSNILNQSIYNGLQGSFRFNKFGDINRNRYIYKINDGQFEVVKNGDEK